MSKQGVPRRKRRQVRLETLYYNITMWEKEHRDESVSALEAANKANRAQRNLEIAQWDWDSQLDMPRFGNWGERQSWKRDLEYRIKDLTSDVEWRWTQHRNHYASATNAVAKIAAARIEIARLEFTPFRNLIECFTWPFIIWKATRIIARERAAAPTVDPVQQVIHRQMMKIATGEYIYFKNLPSPYRDK